MLSTTALDRRTLQWFATLPRRTAAEGHRRPHTHRSRLLHLRCSTASVDPIFLHRASCCVRVRTLDLALLVDAEHHRPLGRVQVEAHHVDQLLLEAGVVRELEGLRPPGPQAMAGPDPADGLPAD